LPTKQLCPGLVPGADGERWPHSARPGAGGGPSTLVDGRRTPLPPWAEGRPCQPTMRPGRACLGSRRGTGVARGGRSAPSPAGRPTGVERFHQARPAAGCSPALTGSAGNCSRSGQNWARAVRVARSGSRSVARGDAEAPLRRETSGPSASRKRHMSSYRTAWMKFDLAVRVVGLLCPTPFLRRRTTRGEYTLGTQVQRPSATQTVSGAMVRTASLHHPVFVGWGLVARLGRCGNPPTFTAPLRGDLGMLSGLDVGGGGPVEWEDRERAGARPGSVSHARGSALRSRNAPMRAQGANGEGTRCRARNALLPQRCGRFGDPPRTPSPGKKTHCLSRTR